MPAKRVYEILDSIRGVHHQLADRYRELDAVATDDRLHDLFEDMERRERSFDDYVAQCESDEHSTVLETWMQFVPDEAVQIDHLSKRLAEPRTLEDLVEETLILNSKLCDAYLALAKEAPTAEMEMLFKNLAQLEECNDCHYAKVLLDDL